VGECARELMLADAIRGRWPEARIEFARKRGNPRFDHDAYVHHKFDGNVSQRPEEWSRLVAQLRLDLVVFDNTGRTEHLRATRAAGARSIYLTSVVQTRRRLFRFRRLRVVDEVLIVQVPPGRARRLGAREQLVLQLTGGIPGRWFESSFPRPDERRRRALLECLGVAGETAVFVAGGGKHSHRGRPVSEMLLDAATTVARETGTQTVVVTGPLYTKALAGSGPVVTVGQLRPDELADLLSVGSPVVCGSGGVL